MPQNVFIFLFPEIIVSNDAIQLHISSIKHYGTEMFTLFYTLCGKTVTKTRLELNAEGMVTTTTTTTIMIINIMAIPS
jgi:hypothetical protein